MSAVWNFAYGSNLDPERVRARGVEPLRFEPATLYGWELSFDMVGTPPGEPCYATLYRSGPAVCVHGALLELSVTDLDRLLLSELTRREAPGPGYELVTVRASTYAGETREAVALIARPTRLMDGMVPSERYLGTLRRGAAMLGLHEDYRAYLERIPSLRPGPRQAAVKLVLACFLAPALVPTLLAWRLLGWPRPLANVLRAIGPALARGTARLPSRFVGTPELVEGLDWHGLAARFPSFRTRSAAMWPGPDWTGARAATPAGGDTWTTSD